MKTLHRQIRSHYQGKRQIPFVATDHEINHGRDISWIVEVAANGIRYSKPFQTTHLALYIQRTSRCDTSLRTTPEALLKLVRDRWSIEGWQWIRDTQHHEDAHRYRVSGASVMATLRTAALNLMRLAEFQSIRAGFVLRRLGRRDAQRNAEFTAGAHQPAASGIRPDDQLDRHPPLGGTPQPDIMATREVVEVVEVIPPEELFTNPRQERSRRFLVQIL